MSKRNQENTAFLLQEIQWLEQLISLRKDFVNGKKILPKVYHSLTFSLVEGGPELTSVDKVPVLDMPAGKKIEKFLEAGKGVNVIEREGDWIKVQLSAEGENTSRQLFVTNHLIEGWVDRRYTNIPEWYYPDMTLKAFAEVEKGLSPEEEEKFIESIKAYQKQRLLENIYISKNIYEFSAPKVEEYEGAYAAFVEEYELSFEERLLLIMGLAHHLDPGFYERSLGTLALDRRWAAYVGLLKGSSFAGMLPSGLTYLFILAENKQEERARLLTQLFHDNKLIKNNIMAVLPSAKGEPFLCGSIVVDKHYATHFITGKRVMEETQSPLKEELNNPRP